MPEQNAPEYKIEAIKNLRLMAFLDYAKNKSWLKHIKFKQKAYQESVALFAEKFAPNLERYNVAMIQSLMDPQNLDRLSQSPEFQNDASEMLNTLKSGIVNIYNSHKQEVIGELEKQLAEMLPPSELEKHLEKIRKGYAYADEGHFYTIKQLMGFK